MSGFRRTVAITPLAFALSYCGGQTAGEQIEFEAEMRAVAASGDPSSFETAAGWSVRVESAAFLVGPAFFFGGGQRADRVVPLGLPEAFAHPSDETFDMGPILGELLEQRAVDLLGPEPEPLGRIQGFKGTLGTIELQLRPQGYGPLGGGRAVQVLGPHSFRIVGVAEKDGRTVPFVAEGDLENDNDQQVIGSIEASLELSARPGRLTIEVHLDEWLGLVDFARLTTFDEAGRALFGPDDQPTAALHRGIRSRFAYSVRWRTP